MFRLVNWDPNRYEGSFIRLCDNQRVPLDLSMLRLSYITLSEFQTQYYSLSQTQEEAYERGMYASKIHIRYKVGIDLYSENDSTYCETIAVEPMNINVQDVNIFLP